MTFYQSISGKPIDGSPENSFASPFVLIPDGTQAIAMIKSYELKELNGIDPHYQIIWKIVDGEFKNKEVRQSIKAFDRSEEKRERAINMMVRLFNLCDCAPLHQNAPTNQDLMRLHNKICGIKIQEWSMPKPDGSIGEGNWVSEVHKADSEFRVMTGVKMIKPSDGFRVESAFSRNNVVKQDTLDDDIPFSNPL